MRDELVAALRALRSTPGPVSAAILTLALAAAIGGRWLQSLLCDTSRTDPIVLGSAAALMLIVALVATLLPARAASRADPTSLLRSE